MKFTPILLALTLPVLATLVCFAGVPPKEATITAVAGGNEPAPSRLTKEEVDRLFKLAVKELGPALPPEDGPIAVRKCDEMEVRFSHPHAVVQCTYPLIDRFPEGLRAALRDNLRDAFRRTERWFHEYVETIEDEGPTGVGWDYLECWDVGVQTDRLASLTAKVDYYSGGAHRNSHFHCRTVWVDAGQTKILRLAELFNPCLPWVEEVSRRVIRQLREVEATAVVSGVVNHLEEEDLHPWGMTPKGIQFLFEPYRYGCYAEGEFTPFVSYEEIRPFLNPVGPAAEFLR